MDGLQKTIVELIYLMRSTSWPVFTAFLQHSTFNNLSIGKWLLYRWKVPAPLSLAAFRIQQQKEERKLSN